MRELIVEFIEQFADHFNGKTVGVGGDYGATLSNGPFDVVTYFHQWQAIRHPSMHVQIIQEQPTDPEWFECCGGPTVLTLDVRISVMNKEQGWSIAMALYEELRSWLCDVNYSLAPRDATPTDDQKYLVIVGQNVVAQHVYEGDVFSVHAKVDLTYLRRFE
jgi:hypothetical protein